MELAEFKLWLERCINDAKRNGLTDQQIFIEFLEQVRLMTVKMMIKVAKKRESEE